MLIAHRSLEEVTSQLFHQFQLHFRKPTSWDFFRGPWAVHKHKLHEVRSNIQVVVINAGSRVRNSSNQW